MASTGDLDSADDDSSDAGTIAQIWRDYHNPGLLKDIVLYYRETRQIHDLVPEDGVPSLCDRLNISDLLSILDDLNQQARLDGQKLEIGATLRGEKQASLICTKQWRRLEAALDARYGDGPAKEQLLSEGNSRKLLELGKTGLNALIRYFRSSASDLQRHPRKHEALQRVERMDNDPGGAETTPARSFASDPQVQAASESKTIIMLEGCKGFTTKRRRADSAYDPCLPSISMMECRSPKRQRLDYITGGSLTSESEPRAPSSPSHECRVQESGQHPMPAASQGVLQRKHRKRKRRRRSTQSGSSVRDQPLLPQSSERKMHQNGRTITSVNPLLPSALSLEGHLAHSDKSRRSALITSTDSEQSSKQARLKPSLHNQTVAGKDPLSLVEHSFLLSNGDVKSGCSRNHPTHQLTSNRQTFTVADLNVEASNTDPVVQGQNQKPPQSLAFDPSTPVRFEDDIRTKIPRSSIDEGEPTGHSANGKPSEPCSKQRQRSHQRNQAPSEYIPQGHSVQQHPSSLVGTILGTPPFNSAEPGILSDACVAPINKECGEDNMTAHSKGERDPRHIAYSSPLYAQGSNERTKTPLEEQITAPLEDVDTAPRNLPRQKQHALSPFEEHPTKEKYKRRTTGTTSSFFKASPNLIRTKSAPPASKLPPSSRRSKIRLQAGISMIQMPPLSAKAFGLVQETLSEQPLHLIIATILLNKTTGRAAVPALYRLIARYPTAEALAFASVEGMLEIIGKLGLQNSRSKRLIDLGKMWLLDPPDRARRHRTLNYPRPGDGDQILSGEVAGPEERDPRVGAWEIAHLPGVGEYALDSWRIFCRDRLRGLATDYKGANASPSNLGLIQRKEGHTGLVQGRDLKVPFEPEWKRVLPRDKELKAYLRWMWLKEGYLWSPETGEKARATQEQLDKVNRGAEEVEITGKAGLVGTVFNTIPDEIDSEDAKVQSDTEVPATLQALEHVSSSAMGNTQLRAALEEELLPLHHSSDDSNENGPSGSSIALDRELRPSSVSPPHSPQKMSSRRERRIGTQAHGQPSCVTRKQTFLPQDNTRTRVITSPLKIKRRDDDQVYDIATSANDSPSPLLRKPKLQARPGPPQILTSRASHSVSTDESDVVSSSSESYETALSNSSQIQPEEQRHMQTSLEQATSDPTPASRHIPHLSSSNPRDESFVKPSASANFISLEHSELAGQTAAPPSTQLTDPPTCSQQPSSMMPRRSIFVIPRQPSTETLTKCSKLVLPNNESEAATPSSISNLRPSKLEPNTSPTHISGIRAAQALALHAISGSSIKIRNVASSTMAPSTNNLTGRMSVPPSDWSTQHFPTSKRTSTATSIHGASRSVQCSTPKFTAINRPPNVIAAQTHKGAGKLPSLRSASDRSNRKVLPSERMAASRSSCTASGSMAPHVAELCVSRPETPNVRDACCEDETDTKGDEVMEATGNGTIVEKHKGREYPEDMSTSHDRALVNRAGEDRRRLEAATRSNSKTASTLREGGSRDIDGEVEKEEDAIPRNVFARRMSLRS